MAIHPQSPTREQSLGFPATKERLLLDPGHQLADASAQHPDREK